MLFKRAAPVFPTWTDEAVARLSALNAKGITTREIANAISAEFGMTFTRNAVIGKIHRLGIANERASAREDDPRVQMIRELDAQGVSRREIIATVRCRFELVTAVLGRLPKKEAIARRNSGRRTAQSWSAPAIRAETGFTDASLRLRFEDLKATSCRWPVGHPGKDLLFCGAEKIEGKPYCACHCKTAYRIEPARQVTAHLPAHRDDKTFRRFA